MVGNEYLYLIYDRQNDTYIANLAARKDDVSWFYDSEEFLKKNWSDMLKGAGKGAAALYSFGYTVIAEQLYKNSKLHNTIEACEELSRLTGYMFLVPTKKETERVKRNAEQCVVLRRSDNTELFKPKRKV